MTIRPLAASVAVALVAATARLYAQQPSSSGTQEQVLDVPGGKVRVVTLATGLFHPWSLAILPDGAVLVAERNGDLRIIRNGVLAPKPVWTSPTPRGQS